MATISLVSLNIERSKHLDLIIPFLEKRRPDVVTLQECMQRDLPLFEKVLNVTSFFTPLNHLKMPDEAEGIEGSAIFAREFVSTGAEYYAGEHDPIPIHTEDKIESIARIAKAFSYIEMEKDGVRFHIATTHFTWSPGGETTDAQRKDLQGLFRATEALPECILTGDFNAPRGREIWEAIAEKFKDNIPEHYTSSIDPMHRAAPLSYVVDGLFTTPEYIASEVELHEGLSDHKGISAILTKV